MVEAHPKAGAREWVGLAVLVLPCVLVSMDMSVLFMALPFLSADLRPGSSELLWIMDVYGFLLAGLLITMGTLGDRFGRRKVLLFGAVAFGVASVLAAYSDSATALILSRALLGVAGATLAPSTLSLIRNMFHDPRQRTAAIGIWTAGFAGGGVLGPILGGVLLEHFWWGSVFLINVPVMVLLLVLGPVLLPEFRDPKPGRFDLLGAFLSLIAVLGFVYGVKKLAEDGFSWPRVLAIVVGVTVGAVFLRRQQVVEHPMIDVGLFGSRRFSVSLATNGLVMFSLVGFGLFSSQYLQLVHGMKPLESAMWLLPTFLVMPVGVAVGTMLAPRLGKPNVIVIGLTIAVCGYLLLSRVEADSGAWLLVTANAIMALGIGTVFALVTDMVLAAAPPERAGSASAMSETAAEFGGALGIAILGSVGTYVYRSDVGDDAPHGLSAEQLEAARDTLGGAVETALTLPADKGPALLDAAFRAFAHEMRVIALVGVVLMAATAILVGTMLRGMRDTPPPVNAADTPGLPGPATGPDTANTGEAHGEPTAAPDGGTGTAGAGRERVS